MGIFFMAIISKTSLSDVDRDNIKAWESFISEITLEWLLWNECDTTLDKWCTNDLRSVREYDIATYSSHLEIVYRHDRYSFYLPLNMVSRTLPLGNDYSLIPLLCLKTMDEFTRIRNL